MALPAFILTRLAPSIVTWVKDLLSTTVAKSIVDKVLFFLALKLVLTALFVVALPIVLNNLIYDLMEISSNYMLSVASTPAGLDAAMQFTGLMAWFVDCFKIPECMSITVSALQFRLILANIPFIGLRS